MSKIIAAYGGGFKPPTKGHFEVVQKALNQNPKIDEFTIYVGSGERDGINQAQAILIWEIYQTYLPMKVKIEPSKAPIGDIIRLGKNNLQDEVYFVIGAREGFEGDIKDIESRTKNIEEKYPNMRIKVIQTTDSGMSGTNARKASKVSYKDFIKFIPDELSDKEKEEVYNIVKPALNENASYTQEIDIQKKIMQLTQHMLDKGYNITPLPTVEFVNGDSNNARDFFGKTAYYDPNTKHIVLFTEGRHPKDIVRSFSHEMVHHTQNLEGRLGNITTTNTQEDDHLNDIEAEANLKGTMTFRNWTDNILNEIGDLSQAPYKWKTFPKPEGSNDPYSYYDFSTDNGTKYQVIFNREEFGKTVNYDMSFVAKGKDGKGFSADALTGDNEPLKIMSTIVDITKEQIKKAGDVEFITFEPTKGKAGEEGAKGNTRSKLYKIIIKKNFPKAIVSGTDTVIVDLSAYKSNDLNEAIVGEKIECDNCGWDWNIVDGGDDLFICHKCGHDNSPLNEAKPYKHKHGFDDKLGKDPFGLNQFAREIAEGVLSEGRYDKLTNKLSSIAFESFKDIHDRGDKEGEFQFRVDHPDEEHDIPSKEFYFDFVGKVEITDDEYSVDGGANAGFDNKGEEITPLLSVKFKIPKNPDWQEISFDLKDVVRHELEHLTQDGDNEKGGVISDDPKLARPSKYMKDDQLLRDLIDADLLSKSQYFKLEKEVDAMLQGLYFKAKKSKQPFKNVIDKYLNIFIDQDTITPQEKEDILDIWRSRGKSLSLPLFENKIQDMDYEIYSDMDGVLTDFDKAFMEVSGGIFPSEYEKSFGKDGFWKLIDVEGAEFWEEMPWMVDGKTYWNYIKEYNPTLLSSPSRSSTSRLGKRLWVKNNLPDTKLILAQAKDKQNYAQSNRILIDDRPSNIDQWRSQGGIGILHTSASDTIKQLKELGL